MVYFYLTVYPVEALIASQLDPLQFGTYMATGSHKQTADQLVFFEVDAPFGEDFDWEHAKRECVAHPDGRLKHSVYLGVYRVLERVPVPRLKNVFLVTKDGRTLPLSCESYARPTSWPGYALYKEICPVSPLVASSLPPAEFGAYLVDQNNKVSVPRIVFADIRIIDMENTEFTGHVGGLYGTTKSDHLKECLRQVRENPSKRSKTVDRSYGMRFSYQSIGSGIFVSDALDFAFYPMPSIERLKSMNYDWGRSANMY